MGYPNSLCHTSVGSPGNLCGTHLVFCRFHQRQKLDEVCCFSYPMGIIASATGSNLCTGLGLFLQEYSQFESKNMIVWFASANRIGQSWGLFSDLIRALCAAMFTMLIRSLLYQLLRGNVGPTSCALSIVSPGFNFSELFAGVEYLEHKVHGSDGVCRLSCMGGVSSCANPKTLDVYLDEKSFHFCKCCGE
jgi:hypothetical protein